MTTTMKPFFGNNTSLFNKTALVLIMAASIGSSFTLNHPMRRTTPAPALKNARFSSALKYQKRGPTVIAETEEKRSLPVLNTALVNSTEDTAESSSMMLYDNVAAFADTSSSSSATESFLSRLLEDQPWFQYWGPRMLLAAVACLYGTNFCLGAVMNDALPASAATCARMVLASLVLSPFIFQLDKKLAIPTVLCGCFTAMGYVTQSIALVDTSPATVSFLGAATVLVCPALQYLVDHRKMSWEDAPQTWIAAILCLAGVGVLELCDPNAHVLQGGLNTGHLLALLQAVGFGTGIFMSSKTVTQHPTQALPVTAVLVATTAFISMVWCLCDGWMMQPDWQTMALPRVLTEASSWQLPAAVLWTGILSTSLNFFLEIKALSLVPSSEASVILATEPLWAALFASMLLHEHLGWNDSVGGVLIVAACLTNTLEPNAVHGLFGTNAGSTQGENSEKQD